MNGGDLTNGAAGLSGIILFTDWGMTFIFAVVIIILILNFINSPSGRATLSVREDEIASESMGVNVTRVKVIAFTLGADFPSGWLAWHMGIQNLTVLQ